MIVKSTAWAEGLFYKLLIISDNVNLYDSVWLVIVLTIMQLYS